MKKTKKREFGGCAAWAAIQTPPLSEVQARVWARSGRVPGVKERKTRTGIAYALPMDFLLPAAWRKTGRKAAHKSVKKD